MICYGETVVDVTMKDEDPEQIPATIKHLIVGSNFEQYVILRRWWTENELVGCYYFRQRAAVYALGFDMIDVR
jgi:hypothetical protein